MSRDGTPRLYVVTTPDSLELPLFCSESTQEVADYLGITKKALVKKLSLERRGKGPKQAMSYKVHEVRMTKAEMREVTKT